MARVSQLLVMMTTTTPSADPARQMDEADFGALIDAVSALADECAMALIEDRLESRDARHLVGMVNQAMMFLRPGDGLEPWRPARWTTARRGLLSRIPPVGRVNALRRAGFSMEHIAHLIDCARPTLVKHCAGNLADRPSGRIWR